MVIFENRSTVNVWVHEHRIAEKRHLQAVMARISMLLFRIVEDDAQRMAFAAAQATDAVAHIHAIVAACALHRTLTDRKDYRVALP